jgi:hypothetical protein
MYAGAKHRVVRTAILVLVCLLAGCAAPAESAPAAITTTSSAAPAVAEEERGSIAGLVTDDEKAPIADAQVALIGLANTTTTDAAGRFTFNGLEAGTYSLSVQRLGYAVAARKVDVVAGEVAQVLLVLAPFAIVESYVDARPVVSYIKLGESFVDIASHEGGNANTFCESCHASFTIAPRPIAARVEVWWKAPVALAPVLNDDVFFQICRDFQNGTAAAYRCGGAGSSGTVAGSGYLKNRGSVPVSGLANSTFLRFDMHGGESLAYELKVNSWLSFAYGEDFLADYTALPPP